MDRRFSAPALPRGEPARRLPTSVGARRAPGRTRAIRCVKDAARFVEAAVGVLADRLLNARTKSRVAVVVSPVILPGAGDDDDDENDDALDQAEGDKSAAGRARAANARKEETP